MQNQNFKCLKLFSIFVFFIHTNVLFIPTATLLNITFERFTRYCWSWVRFKCSLTNANITIYLTYFLNIASNVRIRKEKNAEKTHIRSLSVFTRFLAANVKSPFKVVNSFRLYEHHRSIKCWYRLLIYMLKILFLKITPKFEVDMCIIIHFI